MHRFSHRSSPNTPALMRRGARQSHCERGPCPDAAGGPKGSKATEAPALMRREPRQSHCASKVLSVLHVTVCVE